MHWHPTLSQSFLIFYAITITLEVALSQFGVLRARYQARDTAACLAMLAGNIATGAMMAGVVYAGLMFFWNHRLFTISDTSPLAWAALMLLDDFTYYWWHRIAHECRFWWATHVNHHSSQQYNLSVALRQPWTGLIAGTWTPWIPLAFIGFPPRMILLMTTINLFYQYWIHTETIHRMPRWFEFVFNTPAHHRVHHSANPRYLDSNYGGVLILWDRLFGTFVEELPEVDPPRYGIVKNLTSFNPLVIAFHEWAAIARDLFAARSLREAAGVVFGPPGWRADGTGQTTAAIRAAWRAEPQQ